ncbi:MAG: muconolactone Delta-isomerase family protein [Dehalococcoidia bacterium]
MHLMVTITLDRQRAAEFQPLIPDEQARIAALRNEGVIEALYIGSNSPLIWIAMQAESEEQAEAILKTLPLHPYMETQLTPLR